MAGGSPYYLRSKRRRLNKKGEISNLVYYHQENAPKRRKCPFMHLPTELLFLILKNLSYQDLAKNLRRVNKRFKILVEDQLNRSFQNLEIELSTMKTEAMFFLNVTQDPREVRYRCKLLNVIECLAFYYDLIMATIWRYVFMPKSKMCMYGGEILDNYTTFLLKYKKRPADLYVFNNKQRGYKTTPKIVSDIKHQTKLFCRHFENVSEMPINTISKSGAKLLDILDTDCYTIRTKHAEWFGNKNYNCKLSYYFSYAWFAAIECPNTNIQKMSWGEHQKYMYMRLRRLVIAHTEIQMNEFQYLREYERLQNTVFVVPRPRGFLYTGYGEEENRFFFYGTMSQQCYSRRYPEDDDIEPQDFDLAMEAPFEAESTSSSVSVLNEPRLGVHIAISLQCPLRLSPRKAVKSHPNQDCLNSTTRSTFNLKMHIISSGNTQIRVCENFRFALKGKKK